MAKAIIQGSKDVTEQPSHRTWSIESGWATVRTWMGPRDAIEPFAVSLTTQGATNLSIADTGEGPVSTVSATFPDGQDATLNANPENTTWELFGNDLNKDLTTLVALKPSSDSERKDINEAKTYVSEGKAKKSSWASKAKDIFDHQSKGTEGYLISQYVIRKTIKIANNAAVTASLSNTNQVEAPTGVPGILFNVPTEQGDGTIQWLKKAPQVVSLGRGKFQITQEWWGGKWSQQLYGGSETP